MALNSSARPVPEAARRSAAAERRLRMSFFITNIDVAGGHLVQKKLGSLDRRNMKDMKGRGEN
jgi:hypothetical protein